MPENTKPAQPAANNEPDVQLLTAGQTIELFARLLAACVSKLGGQVILSEEELRAADGQQLEHGVASNGDMAIRLVTDPNATDKAN